MPKRLTIDPGLETETRGWVRSAIRVEMARDDLSYRDLADRLRAVGVDENERNIANKVARGELSAATFLLCLKVLGCERLSLGQWSLEPELEASEEPDQINEVLRDELIAVLDRDDEAGVYRLRVGSIATPITVILTRLSRSGVRYALSHAVVVPGETRHQPVAPIARSSVQALRRVVRELTLPYREGVTNGHQPDETWLVPSNLLPRFARDDAAQKGT